MKSMKRSNFNLLLIKNRLLNENLIKKNTLEILEHGKR